MQESYKIQMQLRNIVKHILSYKKARGQLHQKYMMQLTIDERRQIRELQLRKTPSTGTITGEKKDTTTPIRITLLGPTCLSWPVAFFGQNHPMNGNLTSHRVKKSQFASYQIRQVDLKAPSGSCDNSLEGPLHGQVSFGQAIGYRNLL